MTYLAVYKRMGASVDIFTIDADTNTEAHLKAVELDELADELGKYLMVVRFSEYEYYNIFEDEDWVRFMATTSKGTYFMERPRTSAMIYRENKEAFKTKALEAIQSGIDPKELDLVQP